MKKTYLILFTMISLVFSACEENKSIETISEIKNPAESIADPGKLFTQMVMENVQSSDLKQFILDNASQRFDGDFNFLVVPAFGTETKSADAPMDVPSALLDAIAKDDPLLQIYVLHPECWTEDNLPLIIYLYNDFDDHKDEYIDAYTPEGEIISVKVRDEFESQAVIVVSHNERTMAVSTAIDTKSFDENVNSVYSSDYFKYYLRSDIINMDNQQSQEQISTKASSIGDYAIAALLGSDYTSCGRMQMYPSKDYITKVKPSSKSAWSAIEPGIMGDPELYFYAEYGQALGGNYKVNKDKKYVGVGYANRNHIVWKNVNFEMMRWSLFDNGTKMRYEWWEDDGGAIIQHKSSISLEMPTELGKLITPDPINFEIAIGEKDDFAGSVYVYYIDENKHNYNTSYVTFELEYKKQ